jgi:hypothetical protein
VQRSALRKISANEWLMTKIALRLNFRVSATVIRQTELFFGEWPIGQRPLQPRCWGISLPFHPEKSRPFRAGICLSAPSQSSIYLRHSHQSARLLCLYKVKLHILQRLDPLEGFGQRAGKERVGIVRVGAWSDPWKMAKPEQSGWAKFTSSEIRKSI